MNKLYAKYPKERRNRPRLHPVVQLIGGEWREASDNKRDIDWTSLTVANVTQLCRHHASMNPGWNIALTAENLDGYLGDIPPNQLWYTFEYKITVPSEDGAYNVIIYRLTSYRELAVDMGDPDEPTAPAGLPSPAGPSATTELTASAVQAAPAAPPASAGPPTTTEPPALAQPPPPDPSPSTRGLRPVRARRPPKGKEPAAVADAPPRLRAKAGGSLRGTKRSAPSPAPAGPDDHPSDADANIDLPRVQVEHPSSPQLSATAGQPPAETAKGDVSACNIFLNHMGLPHV